MRPFALTALLVVLLCACGSRRTNGGDGDADTDVDSDSDGDNPWVGDDPREHPEGGESWTILIYLVADNDLEPFGLFDLEEMLQVGGTDRYRIVVQADRSAGYAGDAVPGLGDWAGTKRFVVGDGGPSSVEDIGETSMDTADALADFISWGFTTYPADRTALVLWDHGAGWAGFGLDETSGAGSILELGEIEDGIERGLAGAGVEDLSLLAFDACLMSTLEVAHALSPHAEYLLASEELVPGHGLDYTSLAALRQDPSLGPADLGRVLVDGFFAQAAAQGTDQDITFSLIDLYRLRTVSSAVAQLAETLMRSDAVPAIGDARAASMEFGRAPDPTVSAGLIDVGNLAAALAAAGVATGEATAVVQAIDSTVVYHRNGPLRDGAAGISIYFPVHAGAYDTAYDQLAASPWQQLLRSYFGTGGAPGQVPAFLEPDHQAQGSFEDGMLWAWGTLAPGGAESVAAATLTYGIVDTEAGLLVALGDQPAEVAEDGVIGGWDLSALVARQGELGSFVYTSLAPFDDEHLQLAIPMGYVRPNSTDVEYSMQQYLLDGSGGVVSAVTYLFGDGGAVGELQPEPGSGFVPLVLTADAQGNSSWQLAMDGLFDATAGLDYSTYMMEPGLTVWVMIQATDASGQGDAVWLTATL